MHVFSITYEQEYIMLSVPYPEQYIFTCLVAELSIISKVLHKNLEGSLEIYNSQTYWKVRNLDLGLEKSVNQCGTRN